MGELIASHGALLVIYMRVPATCHCTSHLSLVSGAAESPSAGARRHNTSDKEALPRRLRSPASPQINIEKKEGFRIGYAAMLQSAAHCTGMICMVHTTYFPRRFHCLVRLNTRGR